MCKNTDIKLDELYCHLLEDEFNDFESLLKTEKS